MSKSTVDWQMPENQKNLKEKTVDELKLLYPHLEKDSLRRVKSKYGYKDETPVSDSEKIIDDDAERSLHQDLTNAIHDFNIDPRNVAGFKLTSGTHKGYIKNNEGEIEYTDDLERRGITIQVKPKSFEPKWPIVDRAAYDIPKLKAPVVAKVDGYKKAVILPDPQIGYLRYQDGSLDHFHDNDAISIALQIIKDVQPDLVLCLGDFLDLPMFGSYEQSPEFAQTAQMAIDYGFRFLAQIRSIVPNAKIVVIEGNHDRRMEKSLKRNAMAAFGLRRAGELQKWPVLSVPYLCNFDKLFVEYVEGYPAGAYWINEHLKCIHGYLIDSAGSTAKKVSLNERVSTVFGHIHRQEIHLKTVDVYDGGRMNGAYSPGCLCRIDGAVPSAKGSTDLSGRPIKKYEDWQQGLAVVHYEPGDGDFNYQQILINTLSGYKTHYNNKIYTPDKKYVEALESNQSIS